LVRTNIRRNDTTFLHKDDPIIAPLPYLRFKLSNVEIASDKVKLFFIRNLFWEFDIRADYRGHDYEANGMSDRKKSVFGGFAFRFLVFKFEWLKDIMNQSRGDSLSLMLAVPIVYTSKVTVMAQAENEYWSRKYVDYYFGVRAYEVAENRPAFQGQKAISNCYQLTTMIKLSQKLMLRNNLSYRVYDPNIHHSPTVKTSHEYEGIIGFVYEFL